MKFEGFIDGVKYENVEDFSNVLKSGNFKNVSFEMNENSCGCENKHMKEETDDCENLKKKIEEKQREIDNLSDKTVSLIEKINKDIDIASSYERELRMKNEELLSLQADLKIKEEKSDNSCHGECLKPIKSEEFFSCFDNEFQRLFSEFNLI